uniref:Non-specific lipid-transfer protein n=1 Tax=Zea mays TaxID=4577 RepID=C0P9Y4_MAIZE|nr:unknown [Zea mays]
MAAPKLATLALAVLLAATVVAPPAAVRAAMSCSTVYSTLMPCLPFVQMGGAMPPQPCCGGIRSLLQQANNTPDRRTICGCLKNVANGANGSGTYISRAAALPSKCGVALPYKISTICGCLKNVANGANGSGTYISRAAALPSKCGVALPYKISTNVNCNTIN